jgi:hypothetical protein
MKEKLLRKKACHPRRSENPPALKDSRKVIRKKNQRFKEDKTSMMENLATYITSARYALFTPNEIPLR